MGGDAEIREKQSRNNRKKKERKKKRNNRKALCQGPGSPSRDKHNNTFELFCRYRNTRWEKLTASCLQAYRPQTGWNQKMGDADSQLEQHQPVGRMPTGWSCPLWTISIKLLNTRSGLQHTFEGISLMWPLCLAKQCFFPSLFYFTAEILIQRLDLASEIWQIPGLGLTLSKLILNNCLFGA